MYIFINAPRFRPAPVQDDRPRRRSPSRRGVRRPLAGPGRAGSRAGVRHGDSVLHGARAAQGGDRAQPAGGRVLLRDLDIRGCPIPLLRAPPSHACSLKNTDKPPLSQKKNSDRVRVFVSPRLFSCTPRSVPSPALPLTEVFTLFFTFSFLLTHTLTHFLTHTV
jgi:hypothetical protein